MEQLKLTERYNATKTELNRLHEDNQQFLYATLTKYIPKIGYIHQLTFEQLLIAKRFLNELNSNSFSKEMEELELESNDVNDKSTDKFLGVNIVVWVTDIKTRIAELRLERRIANLTHDLGILHRNLDKDSIRSIDLENLSAEKI